MQEFEFDIDLYLVNHIRSFKQQNHKFEEGSSITNNNILKVIWNPSIYCCLTMPTIPITRHSPKTISKHRIIQ